MRKVLESDVLRNVSYRMNFGPNRPDDSLPENAAALAAVAARDLALGRPLPAVVDSLAYFLQTRKPDELRRFYPDNAFASNIDDVSKLPFPKVVEDVLVGNARSLTHISSSRHAALPARYQRLAFALADDMAMGMERRDTVSMAEHRLAVGGRGEAFRLPGDGVLRREDYVVRAQELVGVFMDSAADPQEVLNSAHHEFIVDSLSKVGHWTLLSRLFPDDDVIRKVVSGSSEDIRLLCDYDFLDDGIVDRMRMQMDALLLRARDMGLGVARSADIGEQVADEVPIVDDEIAVVTAARLMPLGSFEKHISLPYSFAGDTWVGKDFVPAGTVVRKDGEVLYFDAVSTETGLPERYDSRNDRIDVFDAFCRDREVRLGIRVEGLDGMSISDLEPNDLLVCMETTRELLERSDIGRFGIVKLCYHEARMEDFVALRSILSEARAFSEGEGVSASKGQHIR